MQHARGFSLIELVIVVVVVTTAVAITIPRMSERDAAYRLDLATRRMHEDLTHARTKARFESRPVSITFDSVLGTYFTWPGAPAPDVPPVDPVAPNDISALDSFVAADEVIDKVVSVSANTRIAYSASGDVLARQVHIAGAPFKAMLLATDFGGESTLTFDGFGVPVSAGTVSIGVRTRARELAVDADSGAVVLRDLTGGETSTLVDGLNTAQDAAGDTEWTDALPIGGGVGNGSGGGGSIEIDMAAASQAGSQLVGSGSGPAASSSESDTSGGGSGGGKKKDK